MKRVTLTVDPDDYEKIRRLAVNSNVSNFLAYLPLDAFVLWAIGRKKSVEI